MTDPTTYPLVDKIDVMLGIIPNHNRLTFSIATTEYNGLRLYTATLEEEGYYDDDMDHRYISLKRSEVTLEAAVDNVFASLLAFSDQEKARKK